MSYYELSTEERLAVGIRDNLVRLACGVEDTADLVADLAQALDAEAPRQQTIPASTTASY
jgi:cystathionine gamma-synthase